MHLEKLKEIVADILEIESDVLVDGFQHVDHPNWDSLALLSVMTAIHDEAGILLDNASLKSCITIEQMLVLVENSKGS